MPTSSALFVANPPPGQNVPCKHLLLRGERITEQAVGGVAVLGIVALIGQLADIPKRLGERQAWFVFDSRIEITCHHTGDGILYAPDGCDHTSRAQLGKPCRKAARPNQRRGYLTDLTSIDEDEWPIFCDRLSQPPHATELVLS